MFLTDKGLVQRMLRLRLAHRLTALEHAIDDALFLYLSDPARFSLRSKINRSGGPRSFPFLVT